MRNLFLCCILITIALSILATNATAKVDVKKFKLALIQMTVEGGNHNKNLAHAEEMIARAAEQGADVVLLPEAMDLGWTNPSALTEAQPVPTGEICQRLIKAAQRHGLYVCSGLTEKEGAKVYNSAVIINPRGEVILKHRKIHELDIGHPFYALGNQLGVCETEFGTWGLMICADATAQGNVLTRSLALIGADVILSPSAWAMPADHDNKAEPYGGTWRNAYRPVAEDFAVWFAAASNVGPMQAGPWAGQNCIGCSLVIGPQGNEVLQGPYGAEADTILYVEVNPEPRPAQGTTWNEYWSTRKGRGNSE